MYCQKCRAPIRLDSSLENLSPAALDLLTRSTGKVLHQQQLLLLQQTGSTAPSSLFRPATYPKERKELYDRVAGRRAAAAAAAASGGRDDGAGPTTTTTTTTSRLAGSTSAAAAEEDGPKSEADGRRKSGPRDLQRHGGAGSGAGAGARAGAGAMSFVMLTASQVVPPPAMTTAAHGHASGSRPGRPPAKGKGGPRNSGAASSAAASLSHQMERSLRLFEIVSARSDIDHPICSECTEILVEQLQQRLERATRERDTFLAFLKQVSADVGPPPDPDPDEDAAGDGPHDDGHRRTQAALDQTRHAEGTAWAELRRLEGQRRALDGGLGQVRGEAGALDGDEERFWRARNAFGLRRAAVASARDGVRRQLAHDTGQLQRLRRTNVYNDCFCIGHDGYFGIINGLRLGRLPAQPVDWAEINAAWGQTVLLLATVADRLGFVFDGYRLRPMGSSSKIEKMEWPPAALHALPARPPPPPPPPSSSSPSSSAATATATTPPTARPPPPKITILELYSSGDLPLGRMFLHRRFDSAMLAFLDCLRQLGDFLQRRRPPPAAAAAAPEREPAAGGLLLPYAIKKDKIGDASIKLGFNQDEAWTRACKYTLTCCKFVLAHASNVGGGGGGGGGGRGGGEGGGAGRGGRARS
ncbi:MAG: autophagy protein 6 [Phylliscum demangeonii]|nr:MAG: autophagy protein 6 [Phylliscum demangeonii]